MHSNINTILIPNLGGIHVIDISSIIRIEAVSSYSKLFLSDGKKIVVSKVLKQMHQMLAGKGFTRVHRSHLINTAWIQTWQLNQLAIKLKNNEQLPVSRRKSTGIRKTLSDQREAWLNKQKILLPALRPYSIKISLIIKHINMKKTTILILAVLLTAIFNYSSGKSTGGPGDPVITTLIVNANVNVVLVDNDKVAAEMTGRHSFTRFVTLTQSGDTLVIGSTKDRDFKGEGIVYVPSSQLRKIRINSDAHIRSLDVLQIPVLDVVINGACDFAVLNIGELKVTGTDHYSFDEDSRMRPIPSSLRRK